MITTNYSSENFSEQNEFNHASLMILGIASVVALGSFLAGCIHWCWRKSEPKISGTPELTRSGPLPLEFNPNMDSNHQRDEVSSSVQAAKVNDLVPNNPLFSDFKNNVSNHPYGDASSFSSLSSSSFSSTSVTPESMRVNKVSSIFNATQSNSFKFVENHGDSNDSNNSKRVQFSELQISEFQMYR